MVLYITIMDRVNDVKGVIDVRMHCLHDLLEHGTVGYNIIHMQYKKHSNDSTEVLKMTV